MRTSGYGPDRVGHYASVCLSKTVAAIEDEASDDVVFLDVVTTDEKKVWFETVQLQSTNVKFKLETGAEVTVISSDVVETLSVQLVRPSRVLQGPAGQKLQVLGQFTGRLAYNNKVTNQIIFVVKNLHTNLLGLPAISALSLLRRVEVAVTTEITEKEMITEQLSSLFNGLGSWREEYRIKLKGAGTTPTHVFTIIGF